VLSKSRYAEGFIVLISLLKPVEDAYESTIPAIVDLSMGSIIAIIYISKDGNVGEEGCQAIESG
jgi:hypothetical protein